MAIVRGESFADALEDTASADEKLVDYLMDLCEIINDRLGELGMSRADLARKLGTTPSRITRILSGEANVTLKTISELDAALSLNLSIRSFNTEQSVSSWEQHYMDSSNSEEGGWTCRSIVSDSAQLSGQLVCLNGSLAA